jgi:hypothetical protein
MDCLHRIPPLPIKVPRLMQVWNSHSWNVAKCGGEAALIDCEAQASPSKATKFSTLYQQHNASWIVHCDDVDIASQ